MGEQTIQKTFFLEMKFTIFVLLLSVLNGKTACKAPLVAHQGLCYAKCPANTIGSGPVCWTDCSKIKKGFADCGAMCTQKTKCTRNTLEAIKSVFTGIAGVAKSATGDLDVNGMIDSVKGTHKEFTY